jgi:hypothetical protein
LVVISTLPPILGLWVLMRLTVIVPGALRLILPPLPEAEKLKEAQGALEEAQGTLEELRGAEEFRTPAEMLPLRLVRSILPLLTLTSPVALEPVIVLPVLMSPVVIVPTASRLILPPLPETENSGEFP